MLNLRRLSTAGSRFRALWSGSRCGRPGHSGRRWPDMPLQPTPEDAVWFFPISCEGATEPDIRHHNFFAVPNRMNILRTSLLLALLIATVRSGAAEPLPTVGSYGFDWLKPNTTKCRKISASDLKTFKSCKTPSGGFGQFVPTHTCRVDNRSEWIIYSTKVQCADEFETMQANAS